MLSFNSLKLCHFISLILQLLIQHFDVFLGVTEISHDSLVFAFEITMCRMHIVQFTFELQPELDFFFVVFGVLCVIFFQFQTHLPFIHPLTFQLFAQLVLSIKVLLKDLLIVGLFFRFLLIVLV